ncbi:DNA-binding protein BIN4 [Nymphaea colorata]|nr:DNA-binding protein BIN4 [Nymphaea colorata]
MSDSRESSPDWLRTFQAPHVSPALSSPSGSQSWKQDDDLEESKEALQSDLHSKNQKTILLDDEVDSPNKLTKTKAKKKTKQEEHDDQNEVVTVDTDEGEARGDISENVNEETLEKKVQPRVSSRLPLVLPDKISRTKALIECEGDALDMSGDVGAVGRLLISDKSTGGKEMLLDLKGTIYKTNIVPSRTFCIVNFSQTEAKVEAIMNDFVQLQPLSNFFEAETMIEGTLDGFSFDSEDEGDRGPKAQAHKNIQNTKGEEDPNNGKTKRKATKSSVITQKKGKTAAKPSKKGGRKTQASKKAKKK